VSLTGGSRGRVPRVGLALAGGGALGAVYEIGALCALDEAIDGFTATEVECYVGVSAGSIVAALLANGRSPAQLVRMLAGIEPGAESFEPATLFAPAYGEWVRGGLRLPTRVLRTFRRLVSSEDDDGILGAANALAEAAPIALFDNTPLRRALRDAFRAGGGTDDFRELERRLIIVATDLETGRALHLGEPGWDDVPISLAAQASSAVPGLYPPVAIKGHPCVDGVLLRTVHASLALDHGVELLLAVNPIVPVDTAAAPRTAAGDVISHGLPAILSQTFRTLVHSRMEVGIKSYADRYPDADVVLFEPKRDEYGMFFANIFSLTQRLEVCDLAYRATRADLRLRRRALAPVLGRHQLSLRDAVLDDDSRTLWNAAAMQPPVARLSGASNTSSRWKEAASALDAALSRFEVPDRAR
jgi:NTE family protein